MILSGKCKEAFIEWITKEDYPVSKWDIETDNVDSRVLNALIIEFFDSVGIYINCPPIDHEIYTKIIFGCLVNREMLFNKENVHKGFDTRQEAITIAIEKANEIFNQHSQP